MRALRAVLILILVMVFSINVFAEPNNVLLTSYNPEYYLKITLGDDVINVQGKLENESVKYVYINNRPNESNVSYAEDESFIATLYTANSGDGEFLLKLYFSSENLLYYRLERVNGQWRFPNENLSAQVGASFEKTDTKSAMIAASYLAYPAQKQDIEQVLKSLQSLSDDICKDADTDYERAKAIFIWVTENIYYDYDAKDGNVELQTIALKNVIDTKRTVCAGFANLYCALCLAQGIDSLTIKGAVVRSNEKLADLQNMPRNHEWSAVKLDERWVFVDCTWSTQNAYANGEYVKGATSQKFFDITAQALSADHRIDIVERRDYFESLSYFEGNELAVINPITPSQERQSKVLSTILVAVIAVTSLGILVVTILLFKKNDYRQ